MLRFCKNFSDKLCERVISAYALIFTKIQYTLSLLTTFDERSGPKEMQIKIQFDYQCFPLCYMEPRQYAVIRDISGNKSQSFTPDIGGCQLQEIDLSPIQIIALDISLFLSLL